LFPATLGKFIKIRSSSFDERMRRDALRVALKDLNRNESESLSYISSVMYKYFKSKLFLRTEYLDPLILENSLKGRISSDNIDKVVEIAKLCDANRFSPASNASEKKIIKDISIILKDIDKLL
tara:strand:- start:53 stop:421 length:369 start_codon:yes stop_codon:yes gene_type:complete